mgnify:CR=1 FL=1
MRVRIKKMPNAAYGGQQPDGALDVTPSAWGGADVNKDNIGKSSINKSLTAVPRSMANLEAEGGETAFGPISGDTIPDHMVIKGPRHSSGGVPLNLPDDTFIFSDTRSMKIKDPKILRIFGKTRKKGGYTPAELAKPYDINKYKAILMDPDSDRKDRETAELMIKNYIMKLGALAIAQESKKGFPQGIPEMAKPYMEANGISEQDLMPEQEQGEQPEMAEGGTPEYPHGGAHSPFEKSMEKAKEIDFTALSAPKLEGPEGQYTEDEVLSNPTGAEPGVRMNTEGELYETQKQEGTPGQDISYEVGIRNAYDVDTNMLADQGAYLAGVATNIGEQVKTSKKMKSIFDKSVDQDARETVKRGVHYANTPGVVAPSGVSPTTVQYKMSQYGGALDKFVYGGDEPINPAGTRDFTTHFNNVSQPVMREQPTYSPATDPNMTKNYMTDRQGNITGQAYVPAGQTYNSRKLNRQFKRGKVQGESFYDGEYAYGGEPDEDYLQYPARPYDEDTQRSINEHAEGVRQAFVKDNRVFKDIFLEKEENRPISRPTMTYGGTPMAMYGMEMGGSYYPTMSTGGASRVRITALPRKDDGGPQVSREDANVASSQAEYDAATGTGWKEYTDANGKKWKVKYIKGKEVAGSKVEAKVFNDELTSTTQLNKDLCARMARGEGEKNSLANYSAADVIAKFYPAVAKNPDSQKYKDLSAQLAGCVNMVGGEKTDEIIDSIKFDPNDDCKCEILDSEGNPTGEYEYYKGTINEETGKLECPPCDYEETTIIDPPAVDMPEPPARWSQRAIGNLLTQGRFRTDAERLDPELVDRPEYSPVLQRRYDQDIQSNLAGLRKSIDTGGGTAQQKLFQNLAALDQATTQVGKRQKQTEDYNINVLNQAAQIAANLQSGTDGRNQQAIMKARGYNASAGDKETAARNAKMQAMNLAKTDAQNEMLQKATWNFNNPEFQIDYRTGMPYYNPNYKEPNPTRGQKDITSEYQRILGQLGDEGDNREIAYNLANKSVYGNKSKQYGGYISGDDIYPFFND